MFSHCGVLHCHVTLEPYNTEPLLTFLNGLLHNVLLEHKQSKHSVLSYGTMWGFTLIHLNVNCLAITSVESVAFHHTHLFLTP